MPHLGRPRKSRNPMLPMLPPATRVSCLRAECPRRTSSRGRRVARVRTAPTAASACLARGVVAVRHGPRPQLLWLLWDAALAASAASAVGEAAAAMLVKPPNWPVAMLVNPTACRWEQRWSGRREAREAERRTILEPRGRDGGRGGEDKAPGSGYGRWAQRHVHVEADAAGVCGDGGAGKYGHIARSHTPPDLVRCLRSPQGSCHRARQGRRGDRSGAGAPLPPLPPLP